MEPQRGYQNNMEETNNDGIPSRKFEMHKVNVKCSECGVEITELPFEPAQDRPVYCRECHQNRINKR